MPQQRLNWLVEGLAQAGRVGRFVLAIAGVPGAGKSTLAHQVVRQANARAGRSEWAVCLAMDGYHLSNDVLRRSGWLSLKGSPETFDAPGYLAMLRRLREPNATNAGPIPLPVYRRGHQRPPGAEPVAWADRPGQRVQPWTRLIVTEGNYLLLDEPPWRGLAQEGLLAEAWWLSLDQDEARRRLLARHVAGGRSPDQAAEHYERVDAVNAERVRRRRVQGPMPILEIASS